MKTIFLVKALLFISLVIDIKAYAAGCSDPSTQLEMNDCAGQKYEKANKELNKAYSEYRKRLSDTQKQLLKNTQLAWIKFRDLACEFESSGVDSGSARPMTRNFCLAEKTRVRLKEIKELASCEEGDLSCPALK
jgi:uncharacterized protein YecT (DUF1311 family)